MNPPRVLAGWELVRRVGWGGMAEVWEARREADSSRSVAIKILRPEPGPDEALRARRFEDEARVLEAIRHPNVVRVLASGVEAGFPYVVMELLEGAPWSELRQPVPLSEAVVVSLGMQALAGLQAVHDHPLGVVHRDLKPSNLFLTQAGEVKVIDFGIARAAGLDQTLTRTGSVRGSLPYCSPEQVRSEALDVRSDLFSLGLVLYELLHGARCFPQESDAAVLSAILFQPIAPLHLAHPQLGRAVSDAIAALTAKDRTLRPASAAAARELLAASVSAGERMGAPELAAWLRGQSGRLGVSPSTATGALGVAPTSAPAALSTPHPRPSRPSRFMPWALAALGLAVVTVGTTAWWRPHPGPPAHVPSSPLASREPPASGLDVPDVPDVTPRELEHERPTRAEAKTEPEPDSAEPAPVSNRSHPARHPPPKKVKLASVSARPDVAPGWLTLGVEQGWGQVKVDGRSVGPTPVFRLELAPGPHAVELTRPSGEHLRQKVTVSSQQELKVAL